MLVAADDAAEVAASLETMGLITSHEKGLELTSEGRAYALRIIRVHRLWERYLADETSVDEAEWHNVAEEIEHEILNNTLKINVNNNTRIEIIGFSNV